MTEEEKDSSEKPVKKQNDEDRKDQDPIDKLIGKQSTLDRIFEELDSLTKKQVSKKKKNFGLIETISGKQIDINILASKWQRYDSQYHVDFYTPVFRLLNIYGDPSSFTDRFNKDIADFKNAVIWSRFPKGQMNELRRINKYKGYFTRAFWNYQGLNEEGLVLFQVYMGQAIDVMKECSTNIEFRKKMYEKYQVPYQTEFDSFI